MILIYRKSFVSCTAQNKSLQKKKSVHFWVDSNWLIWFWIWTIKQHIGIWCKWVEPSHPIHDFREHEHIQNHSIQAKIIVITTSIWNHTHSMAMGINTHLIECINLNRVYPLCVRFGCACTRHHILLHHDDFIIDTLIAALDICTLSTYIHSMLCTFDTSTSM